MTAEKKKENTYQIDMIKNAGGLDPYPVRSTTATTWPRTDDSGSAFSNAQLQFACPQTGEYRM